MWASGDAKRKMKAGIAPLSTTALFSSDGSEAVLVRAQADSNWMRLQTTVSSGKERCKFWNKPSLEDVVYSRPFSHRKQFLSRLRNLYLDFQTVAVLPLTVPSKAQFAVPWLLWFFCWREIVPSGNELIFLLFSIILSTWDVKLPPFRYERMSWKGGKRILRDSTRGKSCKTMSSSHDRSRHSWTRSSVVACARASSWPFQHEC